MVMHAEQFHSGEGLPPAYLPRACLLTSNSLNLRRTITLLDTKQGSVLSVVMAYTQCCVLSPSAADASSLSGSLTVTLMALSITVAEGCGLGAELGYTSASPAA